MSIIKRNEPTIDELLSDPVMQAALQRARKTTDDMRAMLRAVAKRSLEEKARRQKVEKA